MPHQIAAVILYFPRVAMPGFWSLTKAHAWKVGVKSVANHTLKEPNKCLLAFSPQDNLPLMNSKGVLGRLLLLLHMIIPKLLKRIALKINIIQLVGAYKLRAILCDLATRILIVQIDEIDVYIKTLQRLLLGHIVFERGEPIFLICVWSICMDLRA